MLKRSVLGAWRFVLDKFLPVLQVLARCTRWVFGSYLNAHRKNLLLRALRGRKVSAPEPQFPSEPSGNVIKFPQRSASTPPEPTSTIKKSGALAAFGDVSLLLAAGAPVVALISMLMLASSGRTSDRIITTGANETTAANLPGAGTVALGARSTLKMGVTDQWVAMLLEGEAMFDVPLDTPNPLVVETFLATARAAAGAKFRVRIDSSVEFELFAGVVDVFPRGANGQPAKVTLRKGIPYRVPVDMRGAMAASHRGSVAAKQTDG